VYDLNVAERVNVKLTIIEESLTCKILFENGKGGGWATMCAREAALRETLAALVGALNSTPAESKLEITAPDWMKQELAKRGYPV
jgi:hypothetical protein